MQDRRHRHFALGTQQETHHPPLYLSEATGAPVMSIRSIITLACAILTLAGCGGGDGHDHGPELFTTQILSDSRFDGDIEEIGPNAYTVTQGMSSSVQSLLVGIDPASDTEFRAFLDFPLSGPRGVPGNARIDSATLDIYINDLLPLSGRLPIRVDLVAFQPPTLVGTDFDRSQQPALASVIVSPDITRSDVGRFVPINVTTLMREAQRRGLVDFQVRIMEDLGPAIPVLMIIDDAIGSNRGARAPQLTVTYY